MVWVNNLNNDDIIFINYGCPLALDSSDGEATFPVHFEDWSENNIGDYTYNGGGNPTDKKWSLAIACPDEYKVRYSSSQTAHKYTTNWGNTMSVGVSETQSRDYLGAVFQFCDEGDLGASWQNNRGVLQSFVKNSIEQEAGGWHTRTCSGFDVYEIRTSDTGTVFDQYNDAFENLIYTESSTIVNDNINYVSYHSDFASGCDGARARSTFTHVSDDYAQLYMYAQNDYYDYNAQTVLIDYIFVAENQAVEPTFVSGAEEEISHEVRGDINEDGYVNFIDLEIFHQAWLTNTTSPDWDDRCDFNNDGYIDAIDLQVMEDDWLEGYEIWLAEFIPSFDFVWFCLLNDIPYGSPYY